MAKKTGLGKGLSALVESTVEEVQGEKVAGPVTELSVREIHRNEHQPRVIFNEEELSDLADSIKQVGILQPIVVRPEGDGYEIVAGERRFQAACKLGLETVPVVVRSIDQNESLELALIENIQRSDLNSIEEARAYREVMERAGLTQEQLAKRLSKSRSSIANALRLLDLPEEVQQMVFQGKLTAGHARAILGVPSADKRIMVANKVIEGKLSVRQTESLVALFSVEQADKSPRPTLPATFKRVARRLRQELNTNVKIKQTHGKYKIEIDFADEDDLKRLVDLMRAE